MRNAVGITVVAALLSLLACNKAPQERPDNRLYQVDHVATAVPVNFLHKTFKVAGYTKFEFDVPPHSVNPKLQGTFKVFATGNPEEPANIDLLLLTPEQFADFAHEQGEATYAVTGSSSQTIDYALPPTIE